MNKLKSEWASFSRYEVGFSAVTIKLELEEDLGKISEFYSKGWIAALELLVLSAPQGHTIPSGATVITQKKFKILLEMCQFGL